MIELDSVYEGDCLEVMPQLGDHCVDMVLADLPYGTTACKWDTIIPLDRLWDEYRRVVKPEGVVVLTASQPFTSALVMSNPTMFKHEWIWIKNRGSNFANTIREPMKEHESVLVFASKSWTYNKQMQERTGGGVERAKYAVEFNSQGREGTRSFEGRPHHSISNLRVPSSWQKFNTEVGLHPTQKPVALFEYLIRTYTNENDVILDNCAGSGTTGVAAVNLDRHYILIEKDPKYVDIIIERLYGGSLEVAA